MGTVLIRVASSRPTGSLDDTSLSTAKDTKQTQVSILLQGPPIGAAPESEAIKLDDASSNMNWARADSREHPKRFPLLMAGILRPLHVEPG